jgi:hypothetical protein
MSGHSEKRMEAMRRTRDTKGAHLRGIYSKFMAERERLGLGDKPVSLEEVYDFASRNQLWSPPKYDVKTQFRKDLAKALREGYFTDDRGQTVRRYHAAKRRYVDEFGVYVQQVLWADMLSDPPPQRDHMETALKGRREQIVGDCHQLKIDVDYYNGHHSADAPIRMLWDFTVDLDEREQPTEYNPDPADDDL